MQDSTPEAVVYAIQVVNTRYIKIGTTTNLTNRLASLQTGSPFLLEVVATWPGNKQLESVLHRELAQFRINGEWFNVDEQIIHEAVRRFHLRQLPLPIDDAPQELAQIVPIRTETVLTHYPFHHLAKKGKVQIQQTARSERGQTETTWEVENPPGALAYKIDTLVVNRRIDEMRQQGEIPRLIELGSLSEICRELGIAISGQNVKAVRAAIYENAKAFIKADLDFVMNDGREGRFAFGSTRYGVFETGDKLPDGSIADAVYIYLHDIYRSMLSQSRTRPLDYNYTQRLAPAAHRLYELLSFAMFGALTHGRPKAQMRYSEFCESAPLTRHYEFYRVRSQMRKIHQPHIENGYFQKVEFEKVKGQPDWVMKYTPGPRAYREHALFTKKQFAQEEQAALRLLPAPTPAKPKPAAKSAPELAAPPPASQPADPADLALVEQLMNFGVEQVRAVTLVLKDRAECALWVAAWPYQNQKGMDNPPAVLISFIANKRRPLPPGYAKAQQRQTQQQQVAARARTQEEYEAEYQSWLAERLHELPAHDPAAGAAFSQWFAGFWPLVASSGVVREVMEVRVFADYVKEDPRLRHLAFAEWLAQHHPAAL
jgi:hypothetical protein